ncbi:MAG: diacylglycerol/polyprenol kinase family protein [Blastocatellales bacterium]
MPHPLIGMSLVIAIFGALLATLRWYQRRREPHPEIARKLMHLAMGLVTLGLPWMFAESWPVLTLAALIVALLAALRVSHRLRQSLGRVLCGVERRSLGEIYFAAAAAILFALAKDDAILFCVPMLILTLADAAGALIGLRYGSRRYPTPDGEKSLEGSIAFFITAFLSAQVPLLSLTNVGRVETLLIAATLGLLLTIVEAMAWRGLDNLFIPLVGFVMLNSFLMMDAEALAKHLAIALLLIIATAAMKLRRGAPRSDEFIRHTTNKFVTTWGEGHATNKFVTTWGEGGR